jgi:hypothetical protein
LKDRYGKDATPTRRGKRLGFKFDTLKTHSQEILERRERDGGSDYTIAKPDACASRNLGMVSSFFRIQEPGKYTLRMEFQVFESQKPTKQEKPMLVRFPAIEIPVVVNP